MSEIRPMSPIKRSTGLFFLSGGSRRNSVFSPFPAFRGHLHPPPSKRITPTSASVITSPFSDFDPLASLL